MTAAIRVLEVLEAVNRLGRARVGQLHKATGINRPTIVRMLQTLEHANFVRKDPESGVYLPTARTAGLSSGYDMVGEIRAVTAPILAALQQSVAWPSDAAVFDGNAMVVVATTRGQGQPFTELSPGYRAPVFATSLGRAFYPWASPQDRQRALVAARRSSMTSVETIEQEGELKQTMEAVREKGYAEMLHGSGVASLAVPIMVASTAIGAVNVLYLPEHFASAEAPGRLLPKLRATAAELSAVLAPRLEGPARRPLRPSPGAASEAGEGA